MIINYEFGANNDINFWVDDAEYCEEVLGLKASGILNVYLENRLSLYKLLKEQKEEISKCLFFGKIVDDIQFRNASEIN